MSASRAAPSAAHSEPGDHDPRDRAVVPRLQLPQWLLPISALLAFAVVAALGDIGVRISDGYPDVSPLVRWGLLPVFVTMVCWLLLAPGVLLLASGRKQRSVPELVLLGFILSDVLLIVSTSVAKLVGAVPFTRATFLVITGALVLLSGGWYLYAARRGVARAFTREDIVPAVALACIGGVIAAAFLPELFWQDISDDGFEAVEIGRALQWVIVPRFPVNSGFLGLGIGMVTMAWSNHWWMLLLGPIEAAARLPLTLHAAAMTAGLAALAELSLRRRLVAVEWLALVLAVGAALSALSFNASYSLYFSDLSSPPAFEALVVALLCGMLFCAWNREWRWFFLVATLGCLARPTALLVGVFAGVAMWLVSAERRRDAVRLVLLTVAAFALAYTAYELVAARLLGEAQSIGYRSDTLFGRFRYLTLSDPRRLLWVILPAGVVPWLSFGAWRRMDELSRVVVLTTVAYAAVFIPLAFTNLHQFVPAMLLPLVVFWRLALRDAPDWRWPSAAIVGALVSFAFGLPRERILDRSSRVTGMAISYRIGSFDGDFASYRQALRSSESVLSILPRNWRAPDLAVGRSAERELLYYAMLPKPPGARINYVIQSATDPPPPGMTQVDSKKGWSSWVADSSVMLAARSGVQQLRWRRAPYDVTPEIMFNFVGTPKGAYDIDVYGFAQRVWHKIKPLIASSPG